MTVLPDSAVRWLKANVGGRLGSLAQACQNYLVVGRGVLLMKQERSNSGGNVHHSTTMGQTCAPTFG